MGIEALSYEPMYWQKWVIPGLLLIRDGFPALLTMPGVTRSYRRCEGGGKEGGRMQAGDILTVKYITAASAANGNLMITKLKTPTS